MLPFTVLGPQEGLGELSYLSFSVGTYKTAYHTLRTRSPRDSAIS